MSVLVVCMCVRNTETCRFLYDWICVCHWPQIVQIAQIVAFCTWMQRSEAINSNSMRNQSTYIAFICLIFFLFCFDVDSIRFVCAYINAIHILMLLMKCGESICMFRSIHLTSQFFYLSFSLFMQFIFSFYSLFFCCFIQYFIFSWKFSLLFLM